VGKLLWLFVLRCKIILSLRVTSLEDEQKYFCIQLYSILLDMMRAKLFDLSGTLEVSAIDYIEEIF